MTGITRLLAVISGLLLCAIGVLRAQRLNIDLSSRQEVPANTFGAAASQPGVWNIVGLGRTPNLLGLGGSPTPVEIAVTADSATGGYPWGCEGDLDHLIGDNIFSVGPTSTWSATLAGLENETYTVYLYGPLHPDVATGNMIVNGVSVPSITGNDCSLTRGLTFTSARTTVVSRSLSLTGDVTGTGFPFSGLAGLQVVETFIFSDGFESGDTSAWASAVP